MLADRKTISLSGKHVNILISYKHRQTLNMSTLSEIVDTFEYSDIFRGNKAKENDLEK